MLRSDGYASVREIYRYVWQPKPRCSDTNNRINEFLIRNVPVAAWRAASCRKRPRNRRDCGSQAQRSSDVVEECGREGEDSAEARTHQLYQGGRDSDLARAAPGSEGRIEGFKTRRRRFPGVPSGTRRASPRANHHARAAGGPSHIPTLHVRHVGMGHALAGQS